MKEKLKMQINRILLILAVILIAVLVTTKTVSALGVTPGKISLNFEPNLERTITLDILNNEHKDIKAAIFIKGNLTNYINLSTKEIEFKANEESKKITYTIKLPSNIDAFGLQRADIFIREIGGIEDTNQVNIGYLVSVVSQLYVRVPYPGKYAEIGLDIKEAKLGEDIVFFVPVFNLGQEDIKAKAKISIFDGDKELAEVESDEKLVKTKERQELKAVWKSTVGGVLKAIATVDYRGKIVARAEKDFFVEEEFLVQPIDISVEKFKLGDVAKFNILVRNKGGKKIYGVYSQIVLYDKKMNIIANTKSSAIDIEPFSEDIMNSYWDTANVKEGNYDGKLTINYEDKSNEKAIKTVVKKDSIKVEIIGITARAIESGEVKNKLSILWGIIIILIIANIVWFIYFKKRGKKK